MEVSRLSGKLLVGMVKQYRKSGRSLFTIDQLSEIAPGVSQRELSDAARLLKSDGLVGFCFADGLAYTVTIKLTAVRDASLSRRVLRISAQALREAVQLLG